MIPPARVNRRNYYRILHVQPEAPVQVITASYRTMMSKLRLHPDLGGDTAGAALINEAYAVLSDAAARAAYDLRRRQREPRPGSRTGTRRPAWAGVGPRSPRRRVSIDCLFCGAAAPALIFADSRCARCDSPLSAPPLRPAIAREGAGRRYMPRMSRSDPVTVADGWEGRVHAAQLRNLSMLGVAVLTDAAIPANRVIRIVGPLFDVVAAVIACRADGNRFALHASVLNGLFMRPTGVLVSVSA